jgi:hypothetical protein
VKSLLVETTYPELVLHEDAGGPLTISGVASETNMINRNNRLYPRAVMEREVARIAEDLDTSDHVGAVDHPEWAPSVSDLGLKFTRLWMEGDQVRFTAQVIPTARGKDLEAVIRAGVRIGISSRGTGSAKTETVAGRQVQVIQEDFRLETYDAVVNPSVVNARVTQYEAAIREALARLTDAADSSETATEHACSVQATTVDPNGEDMNEDQTADLIRLADAIEQQLVVDEDAQVEDTAVEETVVEAIADETVAEETITAEATDEVVEAAADEAVAEDAAATADTADEVVEAVVEDDSEAKLAEARATMAALQERAARAEAAEARVAELEAQLAEATKARPVAAPDALIERTVVAEARVAELQGEVAALREDAGIQVVLAALQSALAVELAEGDWDILSSLANVASNLEWINHRDDMGEGVHDSATCAFCTAYESVQGNPKAIVALDKALAPLKLAAQRIERDNAAFAQTEGERYGRRMQQLLLAEAKTAAEVAELAPMARARATAEATGRRVLPEIRGELSPIDIEQLPAEIRESRRLLGLTY